MKKTIFVILGGLTLLVSTGSAQKNIIDQVIWVVGDEAILRSDVEEQIIRAKYERIDIPGDPYCVIPEQIAINKLFLNQAKLDSIEVNESSVSNQVENRLNEMIMVRGSKEQIEQDFGKSITEIRDYLSTNYREQMTIQQMRQKLEGNIKPTPADVKRFFKNIPSDSIPVIPEQVEIQIISLDPPIPNDEKNRIKERLREFTERINTGKSDFSILARLYSEDSESAKKGGELGFMGKGQLVPEFANVAFSLTDPKKVSRIVETEFGYHIIQLIERKGDKINCRHILLKPRVSFTDKAKAFELLDSIAQELRKGTLVFENGASQYSTDKNSALSGGVMINRNSGNSKFTIDELAPEIKYRIEKMKIGEISDAFSLISQFTGKETIAIIKLKSKQEAHKANFKDDFQILKRIYENYKKQEIIHNWIQEKQKETYIHIEPEWQNCEFQYPNWIKKD